MLRLRDWKGLGSCGENEAERGSHLRTFLSQSLASSATSAFYQDIPEHLLACPQSHIQPWHNHSRDSPVLSSLVAFAWVAVALASPVMGGWCLAGSQDGVSSLLRGIVFWHHLLTSGPRLHS